MIRRETETRHQRSPFRFRVRLVFRPHRAETANRQGGAGDGGGVAQIVGAQARGQFVQYRFIVRGGGAGGL